MKNLFILMTASAEGLVDVVRVLLASGANRDPEDAVGDTALIFACQIGDAGVVALLEPEK